MVVSSQIDLIDGAVLLAPFRELDEAILLWNLRDRPDNRPTWWLYVSMCTMSMIRVQWSRQRPAAKSECHTFGTWKRLEAFGNSMTTRCVPVLIKRICAQENGSQQI